MVGLRSARARWCATDEEQAMGMDDRRGSSVGAPRVVETGGQGHRVLECAACSGAMSTRPWLAWFWQRRICGLAESGSGWLRPAEGVGAMAMARHGCATPCCGVREAA
jgi:hypothetical protein